MKRLGYAAVALLVLLAATFALALLLVDAERVRDAIGAQLETALGEPVELGEVDLSLFPLPAARIRDARIGDPRNPRAEAREVRVGVSLLGLLAGQVVLRSIELDALTLRAFSPASTPPVSSRWSGRAADVRLAITSLAVHGGTLELGAERLDEIELSGGLDVSLGATLDFSARIPELGRIEDGALEIDGLAGGIDRWQWKATAQLAELDLAGLRERLDFRALWGKAAGRLEAQGSGTRLERAALRLASQDLDVRSGLLRVWGPTQMVADYPAGTLQIDLTQAQLSIPKVAEKPSGVDLRVSAREIERAESTLRVGALDIRSDALRAAGELHVGNGAPRLELESASLDLAALSSWSTEPWVPGTGKLEIASLRFQGDPPTLRADGELFEVWVELPMKVRARLDGAVLANGTTVGADSLRVTIAGETLSTSLRYDWLASQVRVTVAAEGARIEPLLEAFTGRKHIGGRLYGRMELAGPLDPYRLKGSGEVELADGEWRGLSLKSAMLRELPEGTPSDPIDRIRTRFEVNEDEVNVLEAVIEQAYARAVMKGQLYLRDLSVDLQGEISLRTPEMEQPLVLPILQAGGPLDSLAMTIGSPVSAELREVEKAMVEDIRKTQREMREKDEEKRKNAKP